MSRRWPFHGPRKRKLYRLALGGFLSLGYLSLAAAGTNFVDALNAAVRPVPSSWGGTILGTRGGTASDPRSAELADRLRAAMTRWSTASGSSAGMGQGVAGAQQEAMERLRVRVGAGVEVHLRPGQQTVMQIRGGILEPAVSGAGIGLSAVGYPSRAGETARRFLREYRSLFRLEDPDAELALESEEQDELGRWHVRFGQRFEGLPVWPAGLAVHLDRAGNVDLVDGAYVPTPGVATSPVVEADAAVGRAKGSVPGGEASQAKDPMLVVYAPLHGVARLAWKTEVTLGFTKVWDVLVDALDGQVLNRLTRVCDANVLTSAVDLEGVSRPLNVWSAAGKFYLADTTKPSFNAAFDPIANPRGVITIFDAREATEQELRTVFMIESANVGQWLPDGVSAAYNFGETYDYFLERHGRNSLDGQGGNVQAAVRVAQMDNAFWNGNQGMMFFGNVQPYPAALDVVGHELAHGVTQHTADLIYELQPGALNESFSDIFGEMVEARTVGQPDWKMGTKLDRVFRDMRDPGSIQVSGLNRPYPSKMSEYVDLPNRDDADHGGVHINSSIFNHGFYLLAEGLPGAIGMVDAEKIFYRCLSQHLQKQSQFVDARLGCIAAAEALFGVGSNQAIKTAAAFDAVEIFATPPTPPPPQLPPVTGPDSTLLIAYDPFFDEIALGRRETALGDPSGGVLLVDSVKIARPSVAGDGSFAVFVDASNDLGFVETANPDALEFLGLPGRVHSVAMSPDGVQFAFVLRDPTTGEPDNRITVLNLVDETERTFDLLVPVLDGNPADLVLYADSMVFTSDGRQLLYDAVSEIRFGDGTPVQRWSIYRIDLTTETTTVLVPPLEGYNTGNPNLGRAGNRYLTFDATELDSRVTAIVNLDLFTGDLGIVGTVGDGLGYPCFSGDESAVIYVIEDPTAFWNGYSLARQTLSADRLEPVGQPVTWLPDALLGVTYRRGTFTDSNAPPSVSFTAPANGASFDPGSTITLSATATDADGISRVEFYDGANKIGEDATSPYAFIWSNVSAGNYRLLARATDTHGGSSDSATVQITVGQAQAIQVAAARLASQSLRITVTAAPGSYAVEESTNLTQWSNAFTLTVGAAGTGTVDDNRPPPVVGGRFYRVRLN
jgi:Zn-dependent metalloprotease